MRQRLMAALGAVLVMGLCTCSRSALVVDTCAPVPGDADRLQVSFTDSQGATGTASFDQAQGDGPAGTAAISLEGAVNYPVEVEVSAFRGNRLVAQARTELTDGETTVQACLEPVGDTDGGPDLTDAIADMTGDAPPIVDVPTDRPDQPLPDLPDLGRDMTADAPIDVPVDRPDLPPPPDLPPDMTPDGPPPPDLCGGPGDVCTVNGDCCTQDCRPNGRCR
jgi:hypothetical protein